MPEVATKLAGALADEPPLALKEGGHFPRRLSRRTSTSCAAAAREGKDWIAAAAAARDRATPASSRSRCASIPSSAISSKSPNRTSPNVPAHYTASKHRRRRAIHHARSSRRWRRKSSARTSAARQLEYQLFQQLRDETLRELASDPANRLARLRLSMSSARWPKRRGSFAIAGRCSTNRLRLCHHATAAIRCSTRHLVEEKFVPNDTDLDGEKATTCHHHRPEHGRQIDLHPPGRADRPDGADRQLCPCAQRARSVWSTAFSPASARATISRAANRPSWSR